MFDCVWIEEATWAREEACDPVESTLLPWREVSRTSLLHWQEHCLECAPPQCYASCSLYTRRLDGNCRRFVYGIVPNRRFHGLLDYGADLRFRRWGKLEARLSGRSVPVRAHRLLDRLDHAFARFAGRASRLFSAQGADPLPSRAFASLRRRLLVRTLRRRRLDSYDEFVLECHSTAKEPFQLLLEITDETKLVYRHAFPIEPGRNLHTVALAEMNLDRDLERPAIRIYPENDLECRVIFTWLDFVSYRAGAAPRKPTAGPADKVKCVAWDLDNTLWRGTLAESSASELVLNPGVEELIRELDERGILQTIVSKNNHDDAWRIVSSFGLGDYFLYPAINWGQKSKNVQQVADALNINVDTFALIDDSDFERTEVRTSLPQVRAYPETSIARLLDLPEFDVPVTEMSRKRRASYQDGLLRSRAEAQFGGDYEEFLRSCKMQMRLFVPSEASAVERCLELIQRSNQLNLSTRRYTRPELAGLLANPDMLCVALECGDRFGDYGIVGFSTVDESGDPPVLADFVLSCRVAQKRVEHTFLHWLADRERRRGMSRLRADVIRTARNSPLLQVFDDTPFETVEDRGERCVMELQLHRPVLEELLIQVKDEVGV